MACANSIQYHRAELLVWLTLLLLPLHSVKSGTLDTYFLKKALDAAIRREQRLLDVSTCTAVIHNTSNIPL